MIKEKVQNIIDEVFPKIEKHYGFSKFQECTPYVELHKNIYEKYSGEEGASGDEDSCHAEYCSMMNEISIYWPQMKSRKMIVETLVHEYQHHLQSPSGCGDHATGIFGPSHRIGRICHGRWSQFFGHLSENFFETGYAQYGRRDANRNCFHLE